MKPHDNLIIMVDFNAVNGESSEKRAIGGFGLEKKNWKRTSLGILQI